MNPLNYHQDFNSALAKLNPEQLEAVNQIDGPVLVIAGPGTGKTQIISARIGNIIKSDVQVSPHAILCLTYTEAASVTMRQRLETLIGRTAHSVHIYTFHAFCNMVIQENMDHFGKRDLQPASDLDSILFIHELIDNFNSKHLLKRFIGEIYYDASRLIYLFSSMKKENWSPEFVSNKIDEYLSGLHLRDEYVYKKNTKDGKKGEVNQKKINTEKDTMEKTRAAALEYSRFIEIYKNHNRYDYDDMIIWVLKAFNDNENILRRYQEQFQYVLVDEYQDTNGSQNELLKMITSYWEVPNIFVVGDDDQSIFRFQGANVHNLMDFYNHYQKSVKITLLKENYRSSQNILSLSKCLIDNNNERLTKLIPKLTKDLIAKNEAVKSSTIKPVIKEFCNSLHEESSIASELESLKIKGENLNEVAVIYRKHKQVDNLINVLEKKNIPVRIKKSINILEETIVQNIIHILTYLNDEYKNPDYNEFLLYEIMHYYFFRISPSDINKLAAACNAKKAKKEKITWRQMISDSEKIKQLNLQSQKEIIEFGQNINFWIGAIPNMTFQELFEKIINRGGILGYIIKSPEKTWLMQAVITLFDFIKSESAKSQSYSISQFLETIKLMNQNGIVLPINKSSNNEYGVNFTTIHSAKGLEFKRVYMFGCDKSNWESKRGKNNFKLPETLFNFSSEKNNENSQEEDRRLFYVGMTRAKEHLQISYSIQSAGEKGLEKSTFISEIMNQNNFVEFCPDQHISEEELLNYQVSVVSEKPEKKLLFLDHDYIDEVIKNYTMSVTQLNKYLECPVSFYFTNILKVPMAKNESMEFGSAVHEAIEKLFKKMKEKNKFPDKDEFLGFYYDSLFKRKSSFTEEQFLRRMEYGKIILPLYFEKYVNAWNKVTVVEYWAKNIQIEGVSLKGKLDKIEFEGNNVNVVDYKTGKVDNGISKLNGPSEKNPLGGDYWRQIVFYKILVDNDKSNKWKMTSGEMDFIEMTKEKEFVKKRLQVSDDEVKIVTKQIVETYQKIRNHEFEKGCEDEKCSWCNFVKNNYDGVPHVQGNENQNKLK